MCASPIQYSRDFIIEIKEGKKSNITQNKTLINTLINEYFLANLKIYPDFATSLPVFPLS